MLTYLLITETFLCCNVVNLIKTVTCFNNIINLPQSGIVIMMMDGIAMRDVCHLRAVQTPFQIRITDFGLATLLNYSEENFASTGGKVQYRSILTEVFSQIIIKVCAH